MRNKRKKWVMDFDRWFRDVWERIREERLRGDINRSIEADIQGSIYHHFRSEFAPSHPESEIHLEYPMKRIDKEKNGKLDVLVCDPSVGRVPMEIKTIWWPLKGRVPKDLGKLKWMKKCSDIGYFCYIVRNNMDPECERMVKPLKWMQGYLRVAIGMEKSPDIEDMKDAKYYVEKR